MARPLRLEALIGTWATRSPILTKLCVLWGRCFLPGISLLSEDSPDGEESRSDTQSLLIPKEIELRVKQTFRSLLDAAGFSSHRKRFHLAHARNTDRL